MTERRPTREECIEAAGRALAVAHERLMALDPRTAAEEAHHVGGPSIDELEARIRALRAAARQDPAHPTDTSPPPG